MSRESENSTFEVDDAFVESHIHWVRRLARAYVQDAELSEDIEQKTWMRVLERPPGKDGSFRSWVRTVMRRLVLQDVRARKRRSAHENSTELLRSLQERSRTDDEGRALARDLLARVRELPEPYRETLRLRYEEGLAPHEIAERLGVPGSTVRGRLKRGHALLRESLASRWGEGRLQAFVAWAGIQASRSARPQGAVRPRAMAGVLMAAGAGVALIVAVTWTWSHRIPEDTPPPPHESASRPPETAGGDASVAVSVFESRAPRRPPVSPPPKARGERRRDLPALRPASHPFDPTGRYQVDDYVLLDRRSGFAMVREPDAASPWRRENWQICTFTVLEEDGASDVRPVETLNLPERRNWSSISVCRDGIVACVAEPGGNFEAYHILVDARNPQVAELPREPFLRGSINPSTGAPRAITYAALVDVGTRERVAFYVSDGVVEAVPVTATDEPAAPPRPLDFTTRIPDAKKVLGLRVGVFDGNLEAFVEFLSEDARGVARLRAPLGAGILHSESWSYLGPGIGGLRLDPTPPKSPRPLSWLLRMRAGL